MKIEIENNEKGVSEQAAYDDYQERSVTAGDRAERLAWVFVLVLCAQLVGGAHYAEPYVIAGGICYMLLSALQSLWQAVTIWLVKQRVRKGFDCDDYPSWVGGGAWVLYWAKMIAITITAIYAVWHFVRLF